MTDDALQIVVDGATVTVDDPASSLLDVLREQLGVISVKDGCAPQGQCGCCTVLVDGAPRVACVTPVRRVRGRAVTTAAELPDARRWADAFCATGASQCGFCTPGIVVRLAALADRRPDAGHDEVERALLAHLCRCTGWRTILDAWDVATGTDAPPARADAARAVAGARATLEGGTVQRADADTVLGRFRFADDAAPSDAAVAVLGEDPGDDDAGTPTASAGWVVGDTLAAARAAAGTVQGRRTTEEPVPPVALPPGDWDVTLQTSWTDPGYLETDSSWARPDGGEVADPEANGGAFGGKAASPVAAMASELAVARGTPVRVRFRREDTVRRGAKRPPIAAGLRADGTGVVRVGWSGDLDGPVHGADVVAERIRATLPAAQVEIVEIAGPPTAASVRGAGTVEATALAAAIGHDLIDDDGWIGPVRQDGGGVAWARVSSAGIEVRIAEHGRCRAGDLDGDGGPDEIEADRVTLRSYAVGAAHQAASLVTSEALSIDAVGTVGDLTVRSLGILRATDTPAIDVTHDPDDHDDPRPVADAVQAAVAAAVWAHQGRPPVWPTRVALRG